MSQTLAFFLYFAAMLTIGIFFFLAAKNLGEKEYFLGGRSMGPFVTAMSAQASDMSGWLLMGFPGSIFAFGMGKVWIGIGLALGTTANWILVAARLRRFSKAAGDSITLPQYLTNRFASKSSLLKVICAVIFLLSFTVYVASAFVAGTKVFCTIIPWFDGHRGLALLIFASIILIYTFLGGYKAVCWTDFFQGMLMLAAILIVPIVMAAGNFDAGFRGAFVDGVAPFQANPFNASWQDVISGLGWGLGYFGMPHILVRFMSIKKASMVKRSAIFALSWLLLTLGATVVIAFLARTYLLKDGSSLAQALLPIGEQQNVFIRIVNNTFPGFLAGIILAAIIAASMSTADSQLLVASSSFTSDIYKPLLRKNKSSDKEILWVGRGVVLFVTVFGALIALSGIGDPSSWASNIMSMVENAWGLFGSAFGPVVVLSLFWKRFNYHGAVAGILAGAATDILWLVFMTSTVFKEPLIAATGVYEILPGFVVGTIAAVVVTLSTRQPSEEVYAIYDAALADTE